MVAIVPYYLVITVQIFSVLVMQKHRNAPPPPMGAGLAQGGYHHYEQRFSKEQIFQKNIKKASLTILYR